MPKRQKGAIDLRELKKCKSLLERFWLTRYGRAFKTSSGVTVVLLQQVMRDENAEPLYKRLLPEMKMLESMRPLAEDFEKRLPKLLAKQKTTNKHRKQSGREKTRQIILKTIADAVLGGDARFFEEMAEALRILYRHEKIFDPHDGTFICEVGKEVESVDPVRSTLLQIAFDYAQLFEPDWVPLDYFERLGVHAPTCEVPFTRAEMNLLLHHRLPKLRDYDDGEIGRLCKQLGIRLLKDKPGRRKERRNKQGGK